MQSAKLGMSVYKCKRSGSCSKPEALAKGLEREDRRCWLQCSWEGYLIRGPNAWELWHHRDGGEAQRHGVFWGDRNNTVAKSLHLQKESHQSGENWKGLACENKLSTENDFFSYAIPCPFSSQDT